MHRVGEDYRSDGPQARDDPWGGAERMFKHLMPDREFALGLGVVGLLAGYALLIVVGVLLLA